MAGRITLEKEGRGRSCKVVDGRRHDATPRGMLQMQSTRNVIITDVHMMNDLTEQRGRQGDVLVLIGPGGASVTDLESGTFR